MGLSNTGSICLDTPLVSGYRRVPEPPANTIPFISVYLCIFECKVTIFPSINPYMVLNFSVNKSISIEIGILTGNMTPSVTALRDLFHIASLQICPADK